MFAILPSLEVLPLFAELPETSPAVAEVPLQLIAHSSYGEISRGLLARKLSGGVLPWEIFVTDVLALPHQRANWKVLVFIQPCPTELVLKNSVHRAIYPASPSGSLKLPPRLTVGIEGHHSLMKAQLLSWLARFKSCSLPEISFQALPLHLMLRGLQTDALDAIIAPSPWGIHAEATGIGKRDLHFQPGRFTQQLAMVCHRDEFADLRGTGTHLLKRLQDARTLLRQSTHFQQALANMSKLQNSQLDLAAFNHASAIHTFHAFNQDALPQAHQLLASLKQLHQLAILPSSLSANEHTAHRLISA